MEKKIKEGISIEEIENFGRKYVFELFFVLYFFLSLLSSFIFFGPGWSLTCIGIGALGGMWAHRSVERITNRIFSFIGNQEKVVKMILSFSILLLASILPPLAFLAWGLVGGAAFYQKRFPSL